MDTIYKQMSSILNSLRERSRMLQAKKSQSIITSILALTGSRHKMRSRQVTGIPSTPVTMGTATPVTATDTQAILAPPVPVKAVQELTLPAPVTVIPVQPPRAESQLGGSCINNLQVNDSSDISMCSSDSEAILMKDYAIKYTLHLESYLALSMLTVYGKYCLKLMSIIGK